MAPDEHKPYTSAQLMVCAAAREIADGEIVFVGMRLPLLGFFLAKATHAPNAVGVYELGVIRDVVAPDPIMTMGDLPNLNRALWLADTSDIMALLQNGSVDVSFIGGAQIDRFGNLNTNYVGGPAMRTRLPGSGGACDLACLAKRHIIVMAHQRRRFVPRVDFITSPGYGEGAGWRQSIGLPRGGPSAVITTLGIFRFDRQTCEMVLSSLHPGVTADTVQANTGWPVAVSSLLDETPPPTPREIATIAHFDPRGYWAGSEP
jgi:glutaconate CoA-transferase subunit B